MTDQSTEANSGIHESGAKNAREDVRRALVGRDGFPLLTDPVSQSAAPLFVENLLRGAKPTNEWMCGIEFEVFGYDRERDFARIDAAQVERVLAGFAPSSNDIVYEGGHVVEVNAGQMNRLTIEPGGQVEFSGAPQRSLADIEREMRRYAARLREIAEGNDLLFLAAGFDPLRTLAEQHWFPKMRYGVMRPYLAKRGARAWDMMTRTCAVQCNLDYGSVEDLSKKFLVGNRLAPIVTAMFANSPFEAGQPSGYKSTRAAVWLATDPDRTSIAPPALQDDFTPEAFVSYALEVPMIFAQRNGRYSGEVAGVRFGEFLEQGVDGTRPVFGDWADHLTTIFTDARLKQHIEMRSADCVNLEMSLAFQALWKGLLYDADALDEALRIAPRLNHADALSLRASVARDALDAHDAGINVAALAAEIVALAEGGLNRIAPDEVSYLDVLRQQVVADGVSPADILLNNWRGAWHGSIERAVEYLRIA
ncbi:MAG TPA: glutamate-cysteine ligase family protein [Pyrinomonadaceae bacterium]|jgi:glutamate--cysteine ligase|nr:glutamate-cysteine ligase family protein [Pyrinomonadaceae bacterium]